VQLIHLFFIFVLLASNLLDMSDIKSKPISSQFPMSEEELQERMKHAKPLTHEQFQERIKKIRSGNPKQK